MSSTQAKRLWLNLGLMLVLGVVGFGVWLVNQKQAEDAVKPLLAIPSAQLTLISITRKLDTPTPETIRFKREGEQWFMLEPFVAPANPVKMTQLLTLPREAVVADYPMQGQPLTEFGLEPLKVRLNFNNEVIGFGASNPITTQRYLLYNQRVVLVSEAVSGLLEGDVLELVARTLVPADQAVKELTLPNAQVSVSMALRSDWRSASAVRLEKVALPVDGAEKVSLTLANKAVLAFAVRRENNELKLINTATGIVYVLPASMEPKLFEAKPTN